MTAHCVPLVLWLSIHGRRNTGPLGAKLYRWSTLGGQLPAISYVYELRDDDTVVATGRLSRDAPLAAGDTVAISGKVCIVRQVISTLNLNEQRLILESE